MLPVTQYYFDQRDIKNEKTFFNPSPNKKFYKLMSCLLMVTQITVLSNFVTRF